MSLLRRFTGHGRNKNQHVKDDDLQVEMSTSASDGNSPPEKKQQENNEHHRQGSKQRIINGVDRGDKNNHKGGEAAAAAAAPSTPPPQPAQNPGNSSASKHHRSSRSLFKRRRQPGVSESPSHKAAVATDITAAPSDENQATKNSDAGEKDGGAATTTTTATTTTIPVGNSSSDSDDFISHYALHAAAAAARLEEDVVDEDEEEGETTTAIAALTRETSSLLCFSPKKTSSRSGLGVLVDQNQSHFPPTPEAVPLNMELQIPTRSATPPPPSSKKRVPTTQPSTSKSKTSKAAAATLATTVPPSQAAVAVSASAQSLASPPPYSQHHHHTHRLAAVAEVESRYAEKSARLAAHKAHWWSLLSHTATQSHPSSAISSRSRRKNNKRNNNNDNNNGAAAAASLPPRSSPRPMSSFRALRSSGKYSPTTLPAAGAAASPVDGGTSSSNGTSPQHVLITTATPPMDIDIALLKDPEYRSKISKEATALDKEGNDFFQQGNYDAAFLCYEKAMTLKRQSLQMQQEQEQQENHGDHDDHADNDNNDDNASVTSQVTVDSKASILASVATSINNMTYLKQRAGLATAEETMAAYLKSLQIKRDILGPNHLSVGKTLNNIGSVFYIKREFEPALKAYQSAHEIMAAQLGSEHLDVGTVISNIGDVKSAMEMGDGKNKQDAMEYYRRALDIRWNALGPNDPKVIRLMEQLAWLETGKQPQKLDEELSDSEDEEYATEDRKRHEEFQEDVRVLQEELEQDMMFFDLLERKMAIDMVKDKTRCFRELRELQQELDLSNHNNNGVVSPRHEAASTKTATPWDEETTDNTDGSDAMLTTASAPPNMRPTAVAAAEAGCISETSSALKKIGNFVDWSNNNNNNNNNHNNDHHQQQQSSPSLSSFLEKADAPATTAAATGSSPCGLISLHETPRPSPPGSRKGTLTAEERKDALTSVRARLAALRASRGDVDESTENYDDSGNLSVSINSEDKKKYNGNGENSDWRRKQRTQEDDSPSSRNPLEDGLAELTREINRTNAGSFRTSTSPGVLSPSSSLAPENARNDGSSDD